MGLRVRRNLAGAPTPKYIRSTTEVLRRDGYARCYEMAVFVWMFSEADGIWSLYGSSSSISRPCWEYAGCLKLILYISLMCQIYFWLWIHPSNCPVSSSTNSSQRARNPYKRPPLRPTYWLIPYIIALFDRPTLFFIFSNVGDAWLGRFFYLSFMFDFPLFPSLLFSPSRTCVESPYSYFYFLIVLSGLPIWESPAQYLDTHT